MPTKNPKWLNRTIHPEGPYMCLCLCQQDFDNAMKKLGMPDRMPFISADHKGATVHLFRDPRGNHCAIVCMRIVSTHTEAQRLAMLVHEAAHVWQYHVESIGEKNPSDEFMAYGLQWLSQTLFVDYFRQMQKVPKPPKRKGKR